MHFGNIAISLSVRGDSACPSPFIWSSGNF